MEMPAEEEERFPAGWAVCAAFLLAAFVMRGPVTCVGPVARVLRESLGLGVTAYGILAALPVLAFGLFSLAGPAFVRFGGLSGAVRSALLILAAGAVLRLLPGCAALFSATLLIGAGIALLNVLMPVMVKMLWLRRTGLMMGVYTGVIGLSGAVGGLSSAPLFERFGTLSASFGLWGAAGIAALAAWSIVRPGAGKPEEGRLPAGAAGRIRARTETDAAAEGASWRRLLPDPLAWALTGVMGLQSLLIYTAAGWMPTYWQAGGMSPAESGLWLFVYLISGLPASILTARLMAFVGSESVTGLILAGLYLLGFIGWVAGGAWMLPASVAAGAMQGAMLSYAFLMMARKAKDSARMLGISSMAQGIGYLGAGAGPWIFGLLSGNGWTPAFLFFGSVILAWATAACLASGRRCLR